MTSSSSPSSGSTTNNGRDPQADAQSLERIKQILLGDRLEQIQAQLHEINDHLSHRLTQLENKLDAQSAEFEQRLQQEVSTLKSQLDAHGNQQQSCAQNILEVRDITTQLGSRLEASDQRTQGLATDFASQTQALKQEVETLQQQKQKLVGGLSTAFAQLAQDLQQ